MKTSAALLCLKTSAGTSQGRTRLALRSLTIAGCGRDLTGASGGLAGAFLTAIPGGRMTLGNDIFVVSVWHRLGQHVPADVAPPPCKCSA